jgi:hypothetical protein
LLRKEKLHLVGFSVIDIDGDVEAIIWQEPLGNLFIHSRLLMVVSAIPNNKDILDGLSSHFHLGHLYVAGGIIEGS